MLKKLIKKLKALLYAIPFGMKAADEIVATSNKETTDGTSIQQQIEHKSVYADLLKGEVTQEVEELRWEMYKADELANDYKYIGNGQAVKIEQTEEQKKNKRLKFIQYNNDIEYGLQESLKMAESVSDANKMDYKPRKLFKITYDNTCVRFKLENHFEKVSVNLKDGIKTKFYFMNDRTNKRLVPLINLLLKYKEELTFFDDDDIISIKSYIKRQELLSSILSLEFTTFQATNNVPNGIMYKFLNPKFNGIKDEGEYITLEFEWDKYEGGQLLSEKYHSKTAEEKFKNRERRENYVPTIDFSSTIS